MSFAHQSGAGGVADHGLLAGLLDDDHSQYALLAGRAGGQTLIGALNASEHLTLQSTAHATRGYVRAQDDLQLLSNILRGSDGTNRVQLAAASPHVSLADNVAISGLLGVPSVQVLRGIKVDKTFSSGTIAAAIEARVTSTSPYALGIYGGASYTGSPASKVARGLQFEASSNTTSVMTEVSGMLLTASLLSSGNVTGLWGATLQRLYSGSGRPTTAYGLQIGDFGAAGVGAAYGLRIYNQVDATINRCLEVGPSTPYFRVEGGAAPAGVDSCCIINFGGALYRLTRNAVTGAVETVAA